MIVIITGLLASLGAAGVLFGVAICRTAANADTRALDHLTELRQLKAAREHADLARRMAA